MGSEEARVHTPGTSPERLEVLRTVAERLSGDVPVADVLPRVAAPIAALLDAERVVVVFRDGEHDRVAFDSGNVPDAVAELLVADVLQRGETIARSDAGRVVVGTPIRFGTRILGAIALTGVEADLSFLPLLESCAFYLGARLRTDSEIAASYRYAELSLIDPLTGVANRRKFEQTMTLEWARAARERSSIALVLIDVDAFKGFNDDYGQPAGDLCLQQIARAIADGVYRPGDLFARYGSDKFVVLLPGTDVEGATALAQRLHGALGQLRISHARSPVGHVTASAGVAAARPMHGTPSHALFALADAAVYEAKVAGRNRIVSRAGADDRSLSPAAARRTRLPVPFTPLIGRQREAADLLALAQERRLVTVVGTGGIGKTRVAVHVAHELTSEAPDGAWFVDLGAVPDPALVLASFADAVRDGPSAEPLTLETLVDRVARKRALIVVDNCEHVLAETARIISAIVRGAPSVRILATSREPLGIVGEARYVLPQLSLPSDDPRITAVAAARADAVALFVERARAAFPAFALNDENAATVATIVRRLDGIALAIELAAARAEGHALETLAARLDQRFRLLAGSDRSALPRQRTMLATLDWSYDLLTVAERTLFRRLALFAGPFTLDAAIAVCAGEGVTVDDVGDLLDALLRKSLVAPEARPNAYVLLESVHAYAEQKLAASDEGDAYARRHAAYFVDLAEQAGSDFTMIPTGVWIGDAHWHLPNHRAVLEWALRERRDVALGGRLAAAIAPSLGEHASDEGSRWIEEALRVLEPGAYPSIEARLWLRLSTSTRTLPAHRVREASERAVALYRTLDERGYLAHALRMQAQTLCWFYPRERALAETIANEAIEVARGASDPLSLAYALKTLALTIPQHAIEQRREVLEESLALFRRYGNDLQIGSVLTWMSEAEFAAGDAVRAMGYGRAALRYAEECGSRSRMEISFANLAMYAASAGDVPVALEAAVRALRLSLESRSPAGISWGLQSLALVASAQGDPHRSARLLAYCDTRCGTLHAPRQAEQSEEITARRLRVALASALEAAELGEAFATGARLTEDEAVAEALALADT